MELDFFKGALQKVEARCQKHDITGERIYDQIRGVLSMQGSLRIERKCQMAGVSRAGFYRSLQEEMPAAEDMEVRSISVSTGFSRLDF